MARYRGRMVIEPKTSDNAPINVDYLPFDVLYALTDYDGTTPGRLGMTFCPGKVDEHSPHGNVWRRDLEQDLRRMVKVCWS